jgi:murein DD-endopeptidase MepM/ murein hydrolase activator NlpD
MFNTRFEPADSSRRKDGILSTGQQGREPSLGARAIGTTKRLIRSVGTGISQLFQRGKRRFTVMLIPHSEQRVVNFQVNIFTLLFLGALLAVIVAGFFYLSTMFAGTSRQVAEKSEALEQTQSNLNSVLQEVSEVMKAAKVFDGTLQSTMNDLDLRSEAGSQSGEQAEGQGDLAALLDLQEVEPGQIEEVRELENLASMLQQAVEPLSDIREVLDAQKQLLSDIPNYWPVMRGRGHVSMEFGPNIHPITDEWYLHKGIDIADSMGVPVVSAANGKVTELGFKPDYGHYVWIRHKYGFRTRYSHLRTFQVSEGEEVVQGQRIGTLGNSGISTGPHLDFQVWLGTDVVDPAAFLKISNEFQRWAGDRRNRGE